jgi:hypothetical protein
MFTIPIFPDQDPVLPQVQGSDGVPTYITSTLTHPTHFNLEDGENMFFGNVGNTVYLHRIQIPKSKININNEP